jgi:hypothetical protein
LCDVGTGFKILLWRISGRIRIEKYLEGNGRGIFSARSTIPAFVAGVEKNNANLCQNNQAQGQDLNA